MSQKCGKWVSDNDPTGPTSERCRLDVGHDGSCKGHTVNRTLVSYNPLLYWDKIDSYNVLRNREGQQVRLWRVTLDVPGRGIHEVHVLAADEEGAWSQAECVLGFDQFSRNCLTEKEYTGIKRYIVPVSLAIRGWGKQLF